MYEFGEGWSVVVLVGRVMPWSRFGGCYYYDVYKVCCLFVVWMFVDFLCTVLNVLFYVLGVLRVVMYERREMINDRSSNGGD